MDIKPATGHGLLRYLLLQLRKDDDPMREHEHACFCRALDCVPSQIKVFDLLSGRPDSHRLQGHDMVLLGGSGDYSAAGEGPWLERALDTLREIHHLAKPTFASCWGFQAMARAMGGQVIHDPRRAELGTIELHLTPQGRADPVFGGLKPTFFGQAGHEDLVERLPEGAVLLASSSKVRHQAYCFADRPIYCTQFHPELNREDLLRRVRAYPQYVRYVAGMTVERFADCCRESPETERLLRRFVAHVF